MEDDPRYARLCTARDVGLGWYNPANPRGRKRTKTSHEINNNVASTESNNIQISSLQLLASVAATTNPMNTNDNSAAAAAAVAEAAAAGSGGDGATAVAANADTKIIVPVPRADEEWDLKGVFGSAALNGDNPMICSHSNTQKECLLLAACTWGSSTGRSWFPCLDCQDT